MPGDLRSASADALRRIDGHRQSGDAAACVAALHALTITADGQPDLLQELGLRYTLLGLHMEAERCYAQAAALRPRDPGCLYNHATALTAMGELTAAETLLDRTIELAPDDDAAWYNRSTLRRQRAGDNHVAALERQLARLTNDHPARIGLCYALAKEREDLGLHAGSFAALREGADARKSRLRYRVEDDLDTLRLIQRNFDENFFARKHDGYEDTRPLFVVGLPRSGTTLVDRILGSHADVSSRGESSDLAQAVVRLAGPARDKAELVRRSATMDFRALGRAYCATLPAGPAQRVIDKTPGNFLYLALVTAALPQARIVHLRRHPMDACYAMYKTLFRMAYPFSYDLDDLGRYWLGYDALMTHWRRVLPADRFLEVDYEALVADQEGSSRRLIAHAGLPWDDACLYFEQNPEPTLTASAAQVRLPIYSSSVGLWRRYEHELKPLRQHFDQAGVPIDEDWKPAA
ncbi:tetratricopeptide repeat protein [Pseudoxanthomonas sp. 3HH-4]|nr:tetratricopeptide repeat protein [Pseudoxanthomonas sp. 3HH-4]